MPRRDPRKHCLLLLALAVAGCGGGHSPQAISGTGYTFSAPGGWDVTRAANQVQAVEKKGSPQLVAVSRFPLLRVFRPALWAKVVKELNAAAAGIASQQQGVVGESGDLTVAGQQARKYTISYETKGQKLEEQLVFVLRDKTEYLLLCRYRQGSSQAACDTLVRTFKLT